MSELEKIVVFVSVGFTFFIACVALLLGFISHKMHRLNAEMWLIQDKTNRRKPE